MTSVRHIPRGGIPAGQIAGGTVIHRRDGVEIAIIATSPGRMDFSVKHPGCGAVVAAAVTHAQGVEFVREQIAIGWEACAWSAGWSAGP